MRTEEPGGKAESNLADRAYLSGCIDDSSAARMRKLLLPKGSRGFLIRGDRDL